MDAHPIGSCANDMLTVVTFDLIRMRTAMASPLMRGIDR
jgi:hypothetical protein